MNIPVLHPIVPRTMQPVTIDTLVQLNEAVKQVTEQQQTIVYVKLTKQFYWYNEEKKLYERLVRYER